jgi:hypothetical protein
MKILEMGLYINLKVSFTNKVLHIIEAQLEM